MRSIVGSPDGGHHERSKVNGVTYLADGKPLLDEVNRRLLAELDADPRAGAAELARRVGMSAPAVRERLTRLEESGVIRGYRLDVDPAALGLPVAAWVRVRPGPGQLTRVAELAARTP
jgi:Lrp/AsnC family transcriptional regulator, leucine-responsive regulatory protein